IILEKSFTGLKCSSTLFPPKTNDRLFTTVFQKKEAACCQLLSPVSCAMRSNPNTIGICVLACNPVNSSFSAIKGSNKECLENLLASFRYFLFPVICATSTNTLSIPPYSVCNIFCICSSDKLCVSFQHQSDNFTNTFSAIWFPVKR